MSKVLQSFAPAPRRALEAGLEQTPENDDEDAEVPKHWKIADLS